MTGKLLRQIAFEAVPNFRDLGGYRTRQGKTLTWRRVFRSGGLGKMTAADRERLIKEFGLSSIIDLRGQGEIERQGGPPLSGSDIKYYNIPFIAGEDRA